MKLKLDFVELTGREGANSREICRCFGISAATGYKLLKRSREHGVDGLLERSRSPHSSPGKNAAEFEARILEVRESHPGWGDRKIQRWFQNRGLDDVPSASTITAVLRCHGLLATPAGPSGKGWIGSRDEGLCHPLTLLDDNGPLQSAAGGLPPRSSLRGRAVVGASLYHPGTSIVDFMRPWIPVGHATDFFTKSEARTSPVFSRVSPSSPVPLLDAQEGLP